MQDFWQVSADALWLMFSGNPVLWEVVWISLRVSLYAISISIPIAFFCAFALFYWCNRFARIVFSIGHTLVAVPAVVVGLVVYLLLSRKGVLGDLEWIFTQKAMIIGQMLLALPILFCASFTGLKEIRRDAKETAITLGAGAWIVCLTLFYECRYVLLSAVAIAFGRIIAEVGSAMIVGGNILHQTRNITTSIALETSKGEFSKGIALGLVLLILAFALNFAISFFNAQSFAKLNKP